MITYSCCYNESERELYMKWLIVDRLTREIEVEVGSSSRLTS